MYFADYLKLKIAETMDFHGIGKWHEMGYKGKGVRILNLETYQGHGQDTYEMIKRFAPEAEIYAVAQNYRWSNGVMSNFYAEVDNQQGDNRIFNLQEFEAFLNTVDIITISESGSGFPQELMDLYWRTDNILMGAAGNDGQWGVTGRFREVGWSIAAAELKNGVISRKYYSSIGDEVDFACLTAHLEGTSHASPIMAAITALVIDRYGKMPQSQMLQVLQSISHDAGTPGFDTSFGWGVPVLPKYITILEPMPLGFLATNTIFHTPLIQDNIVDFRGREGNPMDPEAFTLHNFGSSATARNLTAYVDTTDAVKSWHFTVGKDAIYQEMSIYKNAWHASDGVNGPGNRTTIAIEVEENLEAMLNAVRLIVWLRQHLGKLPIRTHQHYAPDNKYCPGWILKNVGMDTFIKIVEEMEMKFKDLQETHWGYKAVDKVTNLGLMSGFPEGTFKPDEMLTRVQMAQVLYNLIEKGYIKIT